MSFSGVAPPDPFMLKDEFFYSGALQPKPKYQTSNLTLRSQAYNPAQKTLCLIVAGQSLVTNICPTVYVPSNASAVDMMNLYDGGCYGVASSGGLVGTQDLGSAGPGLGNVAPRIANAAIGTFDRCVFMPIGIGGSTAADWATGPLKDRLPVAIKRFISRGFAPGNTGLTFAVSWWNGETDNVPNGTSSASIQASMATIKANLQAAGFTGSSCRFFVNLESWNGGVTSSTVRAAQAAVVDSSFFYMGGDIDTLNGTNRSDNTHLNDTGAPAAATLVWNAMHASGAPY